MNIRRLLAGAAVEEKAAEMLDEPRKEAHEDITGTDLLYPLVKPYSYANVKYDAATGSLFYRVIEPKLTDWEAKTLKKIENIMLEVLDVSYFGIRASKGIKEYMHQKILDVIEKYDIELQSEQMDKITYYILRDFVGFGKIDPMMNDPNLEDIHCDGVGVPLYVTHRSYGSLKTSVIFEDMEELNSFIIKLAQWSGRHISVAEPLLDGALPDGSRVQATYGSEVTARGSTFTIRKFKEVPLTPVDIILNGTVSSTMLAYFWLAIENRASVLVSGGTATGKTTFLNVLSLFIRPEAKVVSIEDTAELNLPHEHWIPSVARPGYGPPVATGKSYGEVSMFDLLKASMRQRPDYIVVGEVRGAETYVLFQAMATGHAGLSTIHSDSVESLIQRLLTPPINLSPTMLEALDIIVFLSHTRIKDRPARRVSKVVEVTGITPEGKVETGDVFRWRPATDKWEFTGRSQILSELITTRGETAIWLSESQVWNEIEKRERILEWMVKKKITDFNEVARIIAEFYRSPEKLLARVHEEQ